MSYSWPLEPFDKAHPVRAYFNDPRISGSSHAFHFGIDISAPNGTAVYAVEAGQVHLEDAQSVAVAGTVEHGYWHIVPVVKQHEQVARHQLLGHVAAPWLHVHFAERSGGQYWNPLRAGALAPWHDGTTPKVTNVVFSRDGTDVAADAVSGAVDVIAEAYDPPPMPVPAPWNGLPVTPAQLRWRLLRGTETVRAWHTPVDFTTTLLRQSDYSRIYAPGTKQNHAGTPGRYRFYLAHTWSTTLVPDGRYALEVEASDLGGNASTLRKALVIVNNV